MATSSVRILNMQLRRVKGLNHTAQYVELSILDETGRFTSDINIPHYKHTSNLEQSKIIIEKELDSLIDILIRLRTIDFDLLINNFNEVKL